MNVKKVKCWHVFNRRSELLIALLNFGAMAGKLNVPYEPAVAFLQGSLVVMFGSRAFTA